MSKILISIIMREDNKIGIKEDIEIFKINKEILRYAFFNTTNVIIVSLFSFISNLMIARIASREIYGSYLLILAIFNIFSIFTIPGLKTVIFKTSSQNYDGTYDKAIKLSLKASILSIISLFFVGLYFLFFIRSIYHYDIGLSLIFISFFSPLVFSLEFWKILLKGKQKFSISFLFNFMISFLHFILILVFVFLLNIQYIILLVLFFIITKAIFNILFSNYCKKYNQNDLIEKNWKKQGYSLSIMDLSSIVYNSLGFFLLGLLLPLESVAIYGITLTMGNAIILMIMSIIEVFLPRMYRNKKDFRFKDIIILSSIGLVIYVFVAFFIEYPIIILFTPKYSEAVFYTQIFLIIIPFVLLSALFAPYLIKHNLNKEINISKIITILSTVILYLILIPKFGIIGAVISSISFQIVQDIIMIILIMIHKKKIN